ncbi:Hypothetical predicted protein [Podarcis lilfordi]|uniref:Uncharacterized protein n=1 Tax=Podarcis lilfordi TaxID=74358 RepID=A0AA35PNE6_9SAUR|nr:Hypothetical predicted protein [Podarcis lilfordi]
MVALHADVPPGIQVPLQTFLRCSSDLSFHGDSSDVLQMFSRLCLPWWLSILTFHLGSMFSPGSPPDVSSSHGDFPSSSDVPQMVPPTTFSSQQLCFPRRSPLHALPGFLEGLRGPPRRSSPPDDSCFLEGPPGVLPTGPVS